MILDDTWPLRREHVVRWSECDLYGHVNNAAYLTLFEDLRVEHWEMLAGRPVSATQPGPVVAQQEARYLRAVNFRDRVVLTCRVASFRRTSFIHDYGLWLDGVACCTGRAVVVVTSQESGEKVPLWPELRARMSAEGAKEE